MRQFKIFYKRGLSPKFGMLRPGSPGVDLAHNTPEVNDAIAFMQANQHIVGLAVQLKDELFNIIAFEQEAIGPDAFIMGDWSAPASYDVATEPQAEPQA